MSVWTTPTTRSTGQLVTAAIWNTDIVENLKYLKASPVFDGSPVVDGPAIGIGVTPSGWGTSNDLGAVQITGGALWATGSSEISVGQNYYYNGMLTLYRTSAAASEYKQSGGVHTWSTASSGTAGNTFSFTERMRLDASGNVGIGGTPGSVRLDLIGSLDALRVGDSTTNATTKQGKWLNRHYTNAEEDLMVVYSYSTSTDNGLAIGGGSGSQNAATVIGFYTAANNTTVSGTERLRITSGGNVAIGATAKLYLDGVAGTGNTYITEAADNQVDHVCNNSVIMEVGSGGGNSYVRFVNGLYMTAWPTTASAANAWLGDGSVVSRSTSSIRYKHDISTLDATGALAAVMAMRPVTYRGKTDGDQRRFVGFIAEEVQQVAPLLCTYDDGGESGTPNYVTYDRVTAYLVAVVQQQQTEINALKARIH